MTAYQFAIIAIGLSRATFDILYLTLTGVLCNLPQKYHMNNFTY